MTVLRHIILFVLLVTGSAVFAQSERLPDTNVPLNRLDADGKRTGAWWTSHKANNGEDAYAEFGSYDNGEKYGKWYKIDKEGDISAIEMYKKDKLDGEVKYYNKGVLYCTGSYRTVKIGADKDTIVVVHPDTHEQMLREVLASEQTQRHGMWRFYDETSGKLLREEEYQEDDLIFKQNYISPQDSVAMQKRAAKMPHNKKRYSKEITNPKGQVLN